MFADDLELCRMAADRWGPVAGPIVEIGGVASPCLAAYDITIERMAAIRGRTYSDPAAYEADVRAAQLARYQNVTMPLSFLGDYSVEDPGSGGCSIETLSQKYPGTIGCLVCLSTLEHVEDIWYAPENMWAACRPGALVVVSVPWEFPHHAGPGFGDHWRFSPTGLDHLFGDRPRERGGEWGFDKLESGWRLDIDAGQGVLCTRTGKPQAVKSAYWIGRAR